MKKRGTIRRDQKNRAVRSYFDTSAPKPMPKGRAKAFGILEDATAASPELADAFLAKHRDDFRLEGIELRRDAVKEGAASVAVRYEQRHHGLPVYGAQLVVGLPKKGGQPTSAVNKVDYELPSDLTPDNVRITGAKADETVRVALRDYFPDVQTGAPRLLVYRGQKRDPVLPSNLSAAEKALIRKVTRKGAEEFGRVYLAYRIEADTRDAKRRPVGEWEVLVDAVSGKLLAVNNRRRYSSRKAYVFWPDPIISSGNAHLSWSSSAADLDAERRLVDLNNLNPPLNGTYVLSGTWVVSVDNEPPAFPPVKSSVDFKFAVKDKAFLSVMAYYWLDRLILYLRGFGIGTLNAAMKKPIRADAQGLRGSDQSHFVTTASGSYYIAFGEGGIPDASDPHVVVHEYGHAVHYFLGTTQNAEGYEEGFNDFMAAAWLDRFNRRQFQRDHVFPWDNCAAVNWGPKRRLNLHEKFSDARFSTYDMYLKGDVLASALWEIFLAIGGKSERPSARSRAADAVIRTYLEMLVAAADDSPPRDLANGLLVADQALYRGAHQRAIKRAFNSRGLAI